MGLIRGLALALLVVVAGCGASKHAGTPLRTATARPPVSATTPMPSLPDPCKDPKGFARAVQRLSHRPDAEISPRARRLLRLFAQGRATNCRHGSFIDLIQPIYKKK
jgi:hypothetical protein